MGVSKECIAVRTSYSLLLLTATILGATQLSAQQYTTWKTYLGSEDSSHYSALKQIDASNVNQLQVAWTYPTVDQAIYVFNPIIVNHTMFAMAKNFSVVALDAATGREIWIHPTRSPDALPVTSDGGWALKHRGINYWQNENGSDQRLIIPVNQYLEEIDARSGEIIKSFGKDGFVDLRAGLGRDPGSISQIQFDTPGRIYHNLLIVGSATGEDYLSPPGDIRAYDVLTGRMVWIFHTVPHPGEPGYNTWPKEAWRYIGGTNCWGEMSLDEKRGIIYIPIGAPSYDFYGADRIGNNLFADCLLALDARTGKLVWYYQLFHHDLWDYDATAAPQLLTVTVDGKTIPIVAQASKQGFLYVFNRVTGKPLWPIVERPVPKSHMPGEVASATQPFPTKPPPFARQKFSVADLDQYLLTPEERASWKRRIEMALNEGIFTPPELTDTIQMPGNLGGANWGSTASDPTKGTMYVVSMDIPAILKNELAPPKRVRAPDGHILPSNTIPEGTLADQGHAVYQQNCQRCHGIDRKGAPPAIPSLVDAQSKLGDATIKSAVKNGAGNMPPFQTMNDASLNALLAYLGNQSGGPVQPAFETASALPPQYPAGSGAPSVRYWSGYGLEPTIINPPWSTLTAYDMNKGDIKWQVPLGDAPQAGVEGIRGAGIMKPRGGAVVTASGLLFYATGDEAKLRVYDSETGKALWSLDLPAASHSVPAVYEEDGREYIVVCAAAPKWPETEPVHRAYVAFALPKAKE
jgi:quinoprotein glucose dehydrogenase